MKNKELVKTVSAGLFALLSVVLMIYLLIMAWPSFANISDLPEFYAAARMVLSGAGGHIYELSQQQASQQALFPAMAGRLVGHYINPFAMPLIVPIGWVPIEIVRYVWKTLLIGALGISIWLVKKTFKLDLRATLWLIATVFCSTAAFEGLRIDQVSSFLLLGLTLAIWALKENRFALAAIGLSILLLKPHEILPFLLFLLGAHKYKPLLYLCAIAAVLAVIAYSELGPAGIMGYKDLMISTATSSQFLQTNLSPTLRGQLFLLFPGMLGTATAVSSAAYIVSLMFLYKCGNYFAKSHKWVEASLLCAMPLGLVSAPHFFDYDLILLVPSLVVLMKEPLQDKIPPWALITGMLAALMFTIPFAVQIHYEYLLKGGVINPLFWALLLFSLGVLILAFKNKQYFDELI